jgi:hypothetical protein
VQLGASSTESHAHGAWKRLVLQKANFLFHTFSYRCCAV